MASQQPSDAEIDQWMEFTSCHDKQLALRFLQGASNFEQAINNFFDNPHRYDNVGEATEDPGKKESLLLTLKYRKPTMKAPSPKIDTAATPAKTRAQVGLSRVLKMFHDGLNATAAFQIHAPDEPAQSYSHSSAPTRPPSRASHKSTQMQESGVVGASNPIYFGPATRDHYDPAQWALTRPGVTASEVYPDVDLPLRARTTGEPVTIKPLPDAAELPSVFTILTTVPMALELLLNATAEVNNAEGENADPTETTSAAPTATTSFVQHVQSLAAFLIHTNRAYGDIKPLWQQLEALTAGTQLPFKYKPPVDWFLEGLVKATESKLFEICGVMGLLDQGQDWMTLRTQSYHLEAPETKGNEKATLYDALDECVWASNKDGSGPEDSWFHQVPKVLVLRVEQSDPRVEGLNMDVPAAFYMDRYMQQNVNVMREQRKKSKRYLDEIELLQSKIERISTFDISKLVGDVSKLTGLKNEKAKDSRFVLQQTVAALKKTQDHDDADEQELIDRLTFLDNRIETKVKALEEQISGIKKTIQESNNHFKAAGTYGPLNPTNLYTLRGLTAKQGITFVLYPSAENAETLEWWRLEYTSTPEISAINVPKDEVLKAASTSSREVTLVYATEEACKPIAELKDLAHLPPALQAEIQMSNKDFDTALKSYNETNAMDWANSTTVLNSVEGDPPPYQPGNPRHNGDSSQESLPWAADPGSGAVSDREFGAQQNLWRNHEQQKRVREHQAAMAAAQRNTLTGNAAGGGGEEEREVFDFSKLHAGRDGMKNSQELRETEQKFKGEAGGDGMDMTEAKTEQGMLVDIDEN